MADTFTIPNVVKQVEGADYARLVHLHEIGLPSYPHKFNTRGGELFDGEKFTATFASQLTEKDSTLITSKVATIGRLYSVRTSSAALLFADVGGPKDHTSNSASPKRIQIKMQLQVWTDQPELFHLLVAELRVGDIVGFYGYPCRTRTGELSLAVEAAQLLVPHLRDIPRVLDDQETRYRNRSLDFIVNEAARDVFVKRAKIIAAIRSYCNDKLGLIEVETPVLQMQHGGAAAKPFKTRHNALHFDMFMRVSPELYLKMLVVGGMTCGVYELGKQFRNESMDHTHNPEFTSIELYWPYRDYKDLMEMTEDLLRYLVRDVCGYKDLKVPIATDKVVPPTPAAAAAAAGAAASSPQRADTTGNKTDKSIYIDFGGKFRFISVMDELWKFWRHNPNGESRPDGFELSFPRSTELETAESLKFFDTWCTIAKIDCAEPRTAARLLDKLIGHYIEPQCINPTFVAEHPQFMCPLAKFHRDRPGLTERFELFINGVEYVNAYTELNNPMVQREEFAKQASAASQGDDEAQLTDEPFCQALEWGLPPTAGWGMGIDRLIMLLTEKTSIRDVLAFPAMKPISIQKRDVQTPVLSERILHFSSLSPVAGNNTVAIRRETKNFWEGRAPLAPKHVHTLVREHKICVIVERSPIRAFTDGQYEAAGAILVDKLTDERLILGLKELPVAHMLPNRMYCFFSHTFKGQVGNMYRCQAMTRKNITLIDYELIRDPIEFEKNPNTGSRAMKFGPYAGYGGALDTFHGIGLRLLSRGIRTPFLQVPRAYSYLTLEDARLTMRRVGDNVAEHGLNDQLLPFIVAFISDGAVSSNAMEMFLHSNARYIAPDELKLLFDRPKSEISKSIFYTVIKHEQIVERVDGKPFDKQAYYRDAEPSKTHRPIFHERYLPFISVIINGMYWEEKYPRLVTCEQARLYGKRLLALGDLGCDIKGPFEFFTHSTRISDPYYFYDTVTGKEHTNFTDQSPHSVLIYGVDHIPGELAADATVFFGDRLVNYVPMLVKHDQSVLYENITDLPPHVMNAMEIRHGRVVGRYAARIEQSMAANAGPVSEERDQADLSD